MHITDLLPPEDVFLDVNLKDKAHALEFLAEQLTVDTPVSFERVHEMLATREALGSTGIGDGMAVPHVFLSGYGTPRAVLARAKPAIDFKARDKKPVDILFAIMGPGIEHSPLRPFAIVDGACRLLRAPGMADRIRNARNARALWKELHQWEETAAAPLPQG